MLDMLDQKQNCQNESSDDPMSPMHKDFDEWMKQKIAENGNVADHGPKEIPALGPSTLDDMPMAPKGPRLKIECDEGKAGSGFQDLKNAGKFWKAALMLGTRKRSTALLYLFLSPSSPHIVSAKQSLSRISD